MMKKNVFVLVFVCVCFAVRADERSTYINLLKTGKMEELAAHLAKWEKAEPKNPEVYIAYFNYYMEEAKNVYSGFGVDSASGEHYMGPIVSYDDEEKTALAFEYIDKGLKLAPDRLDMHFGKIHVLFTLDKLSEQGDCITALIRLSKANRNQWKWDNGVPLGKMSAEYFFDGIQERINQWLDTRDTAANTCLEKAGKELIAQYPKMEIGYSTMAYFHIKTENFTEAEKFLILAEKAAPNDYVVCYNLARIYLQNGKKTAAKAEFEKILTLTSDPQIQAAVNTYLTEFLPALP